MSARLLTTREVADTLGVSPETVLRYVRRGELPAVRLPGGALRFREAELDAWLEQRATSQEVASRNAVTSTETLARLPSRDGSALG
jgi:excisionase family DNA binding protein